MRRIEGIIQGISNKLLKGDGFYIASLILDWPKIAGDQLSTISRPEKIVFPRKRNADNPTPGTLHLQVAHSAYAFELSYQQEVLIEKINSFFGRELVEKLVFKHGAKIFKEREPEEEKPLTPPQISGDILRVVNQVSDLDLQQALLSLARHLR